jgi:hypothetical protein
MGTKQTSLMQYSHEGDLHITIPHRVLKNFEKSIVFHALRALQEDTVKKRPSGWDGDSIARIIGLTRSGVSDGAAQHDRDLYGDGK